MKPASASISSSRSSGRNGGRSPRASTSIRGRPRPPSPSSGSAVETPQSEPIASGAPAAQQRAERVLPRRPLRAEERDGQVVHLRLVGGPQRLGVGGRRRARANAADVVGMDDLDVGDVRARVARAVGRAARPRPRRAPRGRPARRWRGSAPGTRARRARRRTPPSASGSIRLRPRLVGRAAVARRGTARARRR